MGQLLEQERARRAGKGTWRFRHVPFRRLRLVEPIHHCLVPGSHEVPREHILSITVAVDLGDSAQLRVGAEHTSTVISGAVKVSNCAFSTSNSAARPSNPARR
jgi:hypothetical protein